MLYRISLVVLARVATLLPASTISRGASAQDRLPKEDVIDVQSIGDGLCVRWVQPRMQEGDGDGLEAISFRDFQSLFHGLQVGRGFDRAVCCEPFVNLDDLGGQRWRALDV